MQENYRSPTSLLAAFPQKDPYTSLLFLITGPRSAGKTTWCLRMAEHADTLGREVDGLLSPPLFLNRQKVGIDLVNLSTWEHRRLATSSQKWPIAERQPAAFPTSDISTGHWQFDPVTLSWGNQVLQRLTACDVFILDEIGPLEFHQHKGLQEGLRLVDNRHYRLACVTIRPSLLAEAQARWPWSQIIAVSESANFSDNGAQAA